MSHRSIYETLHVRNVCGHSCFKNYRAHPEEGVIVSACGSTCGCGGTYRKDHEVLEKPPIPLSELPQEILDRRHCKTWLFVLDFFEESNFDIFSSLPFQRLTPLTIEGCVRTFYENYMDKIVDLDIKGIKEIWFGVESGSKRLRKSYTKPYFTNEQLIEVMDALHTQGIKVCWYMVHGPEDTRDTIRETNELVRRCNPSLVWYSLLIPTPKESFETVADSVSV